MARIINMCFSEMARDVMEQATKFRLINDQKIIAFIDELSHGPISSLIDARERIRWISSLTWGEFSLDYNDGELIASYDEFYKEIEKINNGDKIYFWYEECADEMCGIMYTLKLLKNKSIDIYLVNTFELFTKYLKYISRSVEEIAPEEFKACINKAQTRIDIDKQKELLNQWEVLQSENSSLRIFEEGKLASVSQDYFDKDILKFAEKKLIKVLRIIGSAAGYSKIGISDFYMRSRVKKLIETGKLRYEGKFGSMREMEIAITEEGLKYLKSYPEAMEFWNKREEEEEKEAEYINELKNQGKMEERVEIAKKLMDVLDMKIIAEKTGLTEGQIRNL